MSDLLIYADGRLQSADDALAAREVEFLAAADGVFETLLGSAEGLRDDAAHWARLRQGLETLGWDPPASAGTVAAAATQVALSVPSRTTRVRVSVGEMRGSIETWISAQPYRALPTGEGVALAVSEVAHPATPMRGIKSLAWRRTALALQARHGDVFDVIVCDERGTAQEGARSTLFARRGGSVVTPPLSDGCLPGTVRRRLLESRRVREATLPLEALREADEVVVGNSLAGVLPVRWIDNVSIPVGDLATDLQEAWLRVIE